MDVLRTVPADSDCTPLYEIQQPSEKLSEQVPKTLLDVSEMLIIQKSIAGSCNSQNSANSATTSGNTDSPDDDITILHESTRKANSYAAKNEEKPKSDSKNKDHRNNKNIGSRISNEVAIESESRNLSKSKDTSHNDAIITVKVIREYEVHRAAGSKSKRKDVLDNDIRIVDDVTVEDESCSSEPETKSKIIEEDDDIILDAVVLKIKKKRTPVSTSQGENIVDNNTIILDAMPFQGVYRNLTQSMSEDKDGPSNDLVVLDQVPRVDQCSKSKDGHILENDIKILTVSSITNKEYNRVPEFKAENKCNDDNVTIEIGVTEDNSTCSQDSMFSENSKNYIDIQTKNENLIQYCNLPVAKEMKSSAKINTKDEKSFIRQVGHFSVKRKHEVKQSPENSISCCNEIGYSSNKSKYLSKKSSSSSTYKNKNVSRKINCSVLGKNEKSQNEISLKRKEYSLSPKSKAQKNSTPFYDDTTNIPSSPGSIFTRNSKECTDAQQKDVNKIQFCDLPVIKLTKCDVESTTKDRNSFIGKVGRSSVIQSGEVGQSSIKEVSPNNKVSRRNKLLTKKSNYFPKDIVSNNSVFQKEEEYKKNENEIPIIDKEYNWSSESKAQNKFIPFDEETILDADITKNNMPSSQELIFVHNSKNCINVKGEDENKTRDRNLRVAKEVKSGAKTTKKCGKSCIDNVPHSSVIQKGEVRQSPRKNVSRDNEVEYSSKRSKLLTETSNVCNSFKDKNASRNMNCFSLGKKEKSQKNQNGFSVSRKEYNPFHGEVILDQDTTCKKPPNSQKSIFAENSKNDLDIQSKNQNQIQYISLPIVKKMKVGVKTTLKGEKNLISKVAHSSGIQKCEVGQTSMKAESSNNEVGYSTKRKKSLTEELKSCNSFKNRSISSDMNSSFSAKKDKNRFPSTIKKNNLSSKSKPQNIQFASFEDELIMDVDKTENNPHTSKEPSFAHNSKYHIDIQDKNGNSVQCCKLSDVKNINSSVKPTIKGRKNFTGKVKLNSVNHKSKVEQPSIKESSWNNKEWDSLKTNKSLTEESNSFNSNKLRSYSKNVNSTLLEKKLVSKKNQASCSATNTMSQDSYSDFDRGYKCIWCSFATPDKKVIEKHMGEKHKESEKIKCPFCYSRPTNGDFFNHIKNHLDEPPYFCQQCPYSTTSVNYFVSHLTCHKQTSPKKFHCENCSFSTDIRLEFAEHKAVHTPEYEVICKQGKAFSCKVCNKIFHNKMRLAQHKKIHKDEGKNSKKSAESNHHLFQCKNCDFSAGRETTLKRHQVVHHPEK